MKSAVAAANNAIESVQKAAKQAADMAEANFQAMTTTAVKANASQYVASAALRYAELFNTLTAQSETRTWLDLDGNRSVLDASGALQRNEVIGGTANFGQASGTIRPDPELKRENNWEYGVSVQHELVSRVAVPAGYHRRTYANLAITDNLNLSPADWTPFTITAGICICNRPGSDPWNGIKIQGRQSQPCLNTYPARNFGTRSLQRGWHCVRS